MSVNGTRSFFNGGFASTVSLVEALRARDPEAESLIYKNLVDNVDAYRVFLNRELLRRVAPGRVRGSKGHLHTYITRADLEDVDVAGLRISWEDVIDEVSRE